MNISQEHRKFLVQEFRYAASKMIEVQDPRVKLYFFSATFAHINRIMNLEFEPQLAFSYFVLNAVYATINGRVSSPPEPGIVIPDRLFEALISATEDYTDRLERNQDTYDVLERFANLAYATTGNGNYLYQKGLLTI